MIAKPGPGTRFCNRMNASLWETGRRMLAVATLAGITQVVVASTVCAMPLASQAGWGPDKHGMTVDDLLRVETVTDAEVNRDGSLVALVIQRARTAGEPTRERFYGGNVRADVQVIESATGRVVMRTPGRLRRSGFWAPVWSPSGKQLAMLSLHDDTLAVCIWHRGLSEIECENGGGSLDYLTRLSIGESYRTSVEPGNAFLWLSDTVLAVALLPPGHVDLQVQRSQTVADSVWMEWTRQREGREATASVLDSPIPAESTSEMGEIALWDPVRDSSWKAFPVPYYSKGYRSVVFSRDGKRAAMLVEKGHFSLATRTAFGVHNRMRTEVGFVEVGRKAGTWWAPHVPYTTAGRWMSDERRFVVRTKSSDEANVEFGSTATIIDASRRRLEESLSDAQADSILGDEHGGRSMSAIRGAAMRRQHILGVEPDSTFKVVKRRSAAGTEVWLVSPRAGAYRRLLTVNEHLAKVAKAKRELLTYVDADGAARRAVVMLPPGFVRGMTYPLVAWIYPGLQYGDTLDGGFVHSEDDQIFLNANVLAGHGYVLLFPSMPIPTAADGTRDPCLHVQDAVMPAIDSLIARGIADSARLGVIGHSFGGYAVNCIISQTHRFRAAVSSAGPSDIVSFALQYVPAARYTDDPPLELRWVETEMAMGGPPWREPARYARNSPITHVDSVETPILITCGDNDRMDQAEEWFVSLLRAGKRARFVRYWGEGHLLTSPANIRRNWEEIIAWFDTHLEGADLGTR